ncbi:purple acid phosphatase family protein [Haloferula sp. A504]|uniref:purple acid phosphatase family protein n=1 Tax=Haloferula sp. A504 TaxID=3373601 RepID=UPI0031BEDC78|nr:metallophosphoesterase family protein [Verrucomicrobiaceae bacterium E54]
MMRTYLGTLTLALIGGSASIAAPAQDFERAPYVQMATHESIRLVWRTDRAMNPVVRFGEAAGALDREAATGDMIVRRLPGQSGDPEIPKGPDLFQGNPQQSARETVRQYEVTLKGLEGGRTYHYAIFDGDTRMTPPDPSYRFRTHPAPGTETGVLFWVVGDSGTGGDAQRQVYEGMLKALGDRQLDLYLHVGDMAYGSGTDPEFSNNFFAVYDPTLRNTVCWPAMGNHEGATSKGKDGIGPYYDGYICPTRGEAGGVPSGTEAYYSFDYGKVHFISLDSHDLDRKPTGAMAKWLRADLEQTQADWLVAFWHHPPYTKGTHDSDKEGQLIEMREHIMPILEAGGVDVVFTGHSHIWERSMLMDGAYDTPTTAKGVIFDDGDGDPEGDGAYRKSEGLQPHNGTVQVVTGNGGAGIGRRGTCPVMRRILVEHGSALVQIDGNTLVGVMIDKHGERRDLFQIEKAGVVEQTRIANPWQPEPAQPVNEQAHKGLKMPPQHEVMIPRGAEWAYRAAKEAPDKEWATPDFDDSSWTRGPAGFGYGDKDDKTVLDDMKDHYKVVYVRKEFELDDLSTVDRIGLAVSYDDAFIAYLNGKEVLRVGVDRGRGESARGFHLHEAKGEFRFFSLAKSKGVFRKGRNVIAIEGHNGNLNSSDFTLDPFLVKTRK